MTPDPLGLLAADLLCPDMEEVPDGGCKDDVGVVTNFTGTPTGVVLHPAPVDPDPSQQAPAFPVVTS